MLRLTRCAVVGLMIIFASTGCAHGYDNHQPDEGNRGRSKLVVIGGAILLAAIVAHEARSNTRDALRDARPRE